MAHKHRTCFGKGCFKTDLNYSSLENTIFVTCRHCYGYFLMGVKPGRNKREVTQKGNAENGKDQMSHASIIFSSFWHRKNPSLHYSWNQQQPFCWLYLSLLSVGFLKEQANSSPRQNSVGNTDKWLGRK